MLPLAIASLFLAQNQAGSVPAIDFNNLPNQEQTRRLAENWRSKYRLPGVWVAVIKHGKVVGCVASGYRNLAMGQAATVTDFLPVGSVSKVISGTLYAKYVSKGITNFETTVADVFPELSKQYPADPLLEANIRQLCAGLSGLPNYMPGERLKLIDSQVDGSSYRFTHLTESLKGNLCKDRGSRYEYSGLGFSVASAMLERVTGKTFEQLCAGNDGLKSIGISQYRTIQQHEPDEVIPCVLDSGEPKTASKFVVRKFLNPAGDFCVPLESMCGFVLGYVNRSNGFSERVWQQSISKVADQALGDTATGWHVASRKYLFHEGSARAGEVACAMANPLTGDGFVVFTNGDFSREHIQRSPESPFNVIHSLQRDLHQLINSLK